MGHEGPVVHLNPPEVHTVPGQMSDFRTLALTCSHMNVFHSEKVEA